MVKEMNVVAHGVIYRPGLETFPLKYCPHRNILGFEGLCGLCHNLSTLICVGQKESGLS